MTGDAGSIPWAVALPPHLLELVFAAGHADKAVRALQTSLAHPRTRDTLSDSEAGELAAAADAIIHAAAVCRRIAETHRRPLPADTRPPTDLSRYDALLSTRRATAPATGNTTDPASTGR
ncbi:hypothetical protein [Catenuloplanes japonicus]|uniref:hypothetical protein n=1 Tax=Catenuloplanes japonicus TaxID=33876 RepID=UPI000524FE22|nr:hypothetical protein [Catenuloplanes japonicus]